MEDRIMKVLDDSKLNWRVKQEKIVTETGIEIVGQMALVREDTKKVLSIHSDGYYPYQNEELVELLDRVSKQIGLPLRKAGSFGDGEKVYIQLKSNDLKLGNDRIEGYLTGINSFDGTTSLAFGPSNVTISCQNSFFRAFREIQSKVRHTKNMVMRIDEICAGLDGVLQEEKEMFEQITKMSHVKIDEITKEAVVRYLFNIDRKAGLEDVEAISTTTRNKMNRFYVDLNGELKDKGDNMWGLFSGVTKYTTHSISKEDNTEAKMFGIYGKREKEIFTYLTKELV
jgi:hypothetical protein